MPEEIKQEKSKTKAAKPEYVKMKKAQFKDERGQWQDMPVTDYRITPEMAAFEAAKQQKMITRVIEPDEKGGIKVLKLFRNQTRRSQTGRR